MIKILCFGDSNTFGFVPQSGERYDEKTRWTALLAEMLGSEYKVIEAGCNNRTGFVENDAGELFTGFKMLPKYLQDKKDIVIYALGANDLQKFYNIDLKTIENGLKDAISTIKNSGAVPIVIVPPNVDESVLEGNFSFQFDEVSVEKSKLLPELYKRISAENDCLCADLNDYVSVSSIDGLHYSAESQKIIAEVIVKIIKSMNLP